MATQLRELDIDLITRGHLEKGLDSLRSEFQGVFSAETVERYMAESLEALAGARGDRRSGTLAARGTGRDADARRVADGTRLIRG